MKILCLIFCSLWVSPLWALDCVSLLAAPGLDQLPDSPTAVTSADTLVASEDLPAHCRVRGYVAPQVQFELRLPALTWNGKLLIQGCGGLCGRISSAACDDVLARGYAVVTTDMGHQAPAFRRFVGLNNFPAEIDFAYRATHVVTVAAKALVQLHYDSAGAKLFSRLLYRRPSRPGVGPAFSGRFRRHHRRCAGA